MMRSSWTSTVVLVALAGCHGSGAPSLGRTCQYNSECQAGLTCSFGRCLLACKTAVDCPAGNRCVKNAAGVNACLPPTTCQYNSQCEAPLVCAADFQCRNQCLSDRDCVTGTQKCILPDKVCAEPDEVDPVTGGLGPVTAAPDGGATDSAAVDAAQADATAADVATASIDLRALDAPIPDARGSDDGLAADADRCGLEAGALVLPSTISTNFTCQAGCRYTATSNVAVASTATLTVAPGVTIEFAAGRGLTVRGALVAAGTEALPIRFMGALATPGFWQGILYDGSDNLANLLDHVVIENAGTMNGSATAIGPGSVVVNGSRVRIKNTTIRGSSGVGLALESPRLDEFAGNLITQNAQGAVKIDSSALEQLLGTPANSFANNTVDAILVSGDSVSTDQTWPMLDAPYLVGGGVTINAKVAVQAGTKFLMGRDAMLRVSLGSFNAKGAAGREIVFTGAQPTRGYWRGIYFDRSDDVNNLLEHVIVEHAGTINDGTGSFPPGNVVVDAARVQIKNTVVRESSGIGVTLRGPMLDAFAGNTITKNALGAIHVQPNQVGALGGTPMSTMVGNDVDYILLSGGTVSTAQTWATFDVPYLATGDLAVGAALTLSAGTSLVFKANTYMDVNSSGSLTAKGLADPGKQIAFTGAQRTLGYWGGLWFSSSRNANNILDHVVVSDGGGRNSGATSMAGNVYVTGSLLTVTNSSISDSADYGIYWDSTSTVTQAGNTFSGNITNTP